MPFLRSGSRKKKSYINNGEDAEESARRREMVKQKLYAEHMIDDDEIGEDYLERRLNSKSPVRRGLSRATSNRRVPAPNYVDPSGSLRQSPSNQEQFRAPLRRAYSEQNGKKTVNGRPAATRVPPRRASSMNTRSPPGSSAKARRYSMANHPNLQRAAPRISYISDEDEDEHEMGEMVLESDQRRRTPPRRRRASESPNGLQRDADAAMRFGAPRRVKSHYPGGMSPKSVASVGMMESTYDDFGDDHSKSSKDNSEKSTRRGLLRRYSNDFRKEKRKNSSAKKACLDVSEHTTESQKSWFTSGSARSKEEIYNSARNRVIERQAMKNGHSITGHNTRLTLSEQLSKLPPANDSDEEFEEEEDEATESKSIFSSIIQKIENIYEDCS